MGDAYHTHLNLVIENVESELDGLEDPHQGLNSIFKAPQTLLRLYPTLLIPQVVSIGPYHRGKCPDTDKYKARFLRRVIKRTGRSLSDLVHSMLQIENIARRCYVFVEKKDLNSEKFVTMLLLDGCFILELFSFASNPGEGGYDATDPIFNSRGIYPFIQRDLLMLENQIPFCVLHTLFPYTRPESNPPPESVTDLALKFFISNSIIPQHPQDRRSCSREPKHHLDMVGLFLMRARSDGQETVEHNVTIQTGHGQEIVMHSVTTLRVVGVKFVKKAVSKDFMDIEFDAKKGVLKIPKLQIQELTKHMFLNLMAFEHYCPHTNSHLTSYIVFMAGLIHTAKDVEELRQNGIVECWSGGDDDVVHLFNNLRKEVVFNTREYYLSSISVDLHRRFNSRWHNLKADVKREYFERGTLAVVTLLFFATLTQTVFTVLAYYLPTSN